MHILAQISVAIVALLHLWFLALEMLLWDKPLGMKAFNLTPERAELTKPLAANQGLYNGFLAAGLIWALVPIGIPEAAKSVATFFLICVVVAGIFGAITVNKRIFMAQAIPAIISLALLWLLAI